MPDNIALESIDKTIEPSHKVTGISFHNKSTEQTLENSVYNFNSKQN